MPKKTIDYSNCCIYKIEHIDKDDLVYVGHTTNFTKRKSQHKYNCNAEKSSKNNLKLYTMMRDNGGWDMFRMIEVEKYPCKDKREAEKRECEVMKGLKA
jgi:predicted GIY-YIG superfamily endonuclease